MRHRRFRTIRATVVLAAVAVLAVLIAPQAFAAAASVTGTISGDPVAPGDPAASLSFSIGVSSKTLGSFTLSPPSGWVLQTSPAPAMTGSTGSVGVQNNQLVASNVGISGTSIATVQFNVATGCVGGAAAWTLVAKDTQNRTYANSSSSDLSTNVNANCHLAITTQPSPARAGELITHDSFNPTSTSQVTVQLRNANNDPVTYFPVHVGFDLELNGSPAPGLQNDAQLTDASGNATFGEGTSGPTLDVSIANDAQFSDYTLIAKSADYPSITESDPSSPFDIWQDACSGSGCSVRIRSGNDVYTSKDLTTGVFLTASALTPTNDINISCEGQTVIFSSSVFVNESGPGTFTFLKSHVTRADMKASANNGQAHVRWCVGLPNKDDWKAAGVLNPIQQGSFWVAFAPACPNIPDPSGSAPCITRQYGDGNGGSFTEGWLPGDPPRRT